MGNEVYDVQGLNKLTQVIKDLIVDHLGKAVLVDFVLFVEEAVHLIHDVP